MCLVNEVPWNAYFCGAELLGDYEQSVTKDAEENNLYPFLRKCPGISWTDYDEFTNYLVNLFGLRVSILTRDLQNE